LLVLCAIQEELLRILSVYLLLTSYNRRMASYPVPLHEVRSELTISNSRFISTLAPAFSVEQAKTFIQRIKTEFPDATHHVPLYLIGHGDSMIAHCSDAGEPSGTAGRPALAVLRGSRLGDVAVVITRYFGGTKLGTGGLVRAYSQAVRLVVDSVPRAEKVLIYTVRLVIPYPYLERVRLLVTAHSGTLVDESFTADVSLTARLSVEKFPAFQSDLSDLTRGQIQAEIIDTKEVLMPISAKFMSK
jgi:uncharacterized YigZ family protein